MVAITITHRPELLKAGGGDKTYALKTEKGRLEKIWGWRGDFLSDCQRYDICLSSSSR